jgi:subtilisin family serine protease
LVAAGVTVVVAAGNSSANACNYSPARAASAITVGSTTDTDALSGFSNFGTCVDIFAPGSNITSAWYTSTTATATISGTSMASPHVAGAAAVLLGQKRTATPAQVTSDLLAAATTGVVTSAGTGSPNRLLYASPDPATPQALAISTTSLPAGRVGVSYSQTLQANGGTAPYTWTVTGLDTANSGLSATNGVITGTPRVTTTYTLNISVTDSATPPATVSRSMTLTVQPPSVVPGAFNKVSPANAATGVSRTSLSLTWQASAGAVSYQVCLNTTTFCSTWSNVGSSLSAVASSLRSRTIYYWQVRAVNADGTTVANSGTWWRFTTR